MSEAELLARYEAGERCFANLCLDDREYNFSEVVLEDCDFSNSFILANFQNANLRRSNFSNCNVKTCSFRGADLSSTSFIGSAIDGAEFSGANLMGSNFAGAHEQGTPYEEGELPAWRAA